MTRNLKALGLALVVAFALSAVAASAAMAESALFTANVPAGETAKIKGGQIGTDTFTIGALPALTCASATIAGQAVTAGPSSTKVTVTPTYATCHIIAPIIGTRTATVTVNGCAYVFNATKNTASLPFSADLEIECPAGKSIEIHIYNTSAASDTGAAVLCTYDIAPQTILNKIQLTNHAGTPNDVVADIGGAPVVLTNTIKSALCSNEEHPSAIYKGEDTVEATNQAGAGVNGSVS